MIFDAQAYEMEMVSSEDGWGRNVKYPQMRPVPFNYDKKDRQYVLASDYRDLLLKYEALQNSKDVG